MSSTYVDGVTQLDAAHMNALQQKVEKAAANGYASLDATTKVPLAQLPGMGTQISYGTTPPASPNDGDLWCLPLDATNGVMWMFRYRAASASAYKWEYVGGGDGFASVITGENTAGGAWVDLATVGPRVIVPRAGDYDAQGGCDWLHSVANSYGIIFIARNATTPSGTAVLGRALSSVAGYPAWLGTSDRFTGLVAGDDLRLRYNNLSGATGTFTNRWIRVRPVRVS